MIRIGSIMDTHTYTDPTGGGDDITITLPRWANAPLYLIITDVNNDQHKFELEDEE